MSNRIIWDQWSVLKGIMLLEKCSIVSNSAMEIPYLSVCGFKEEKGLPSPPSIRHRAEWRKEKADLVFGGITEKCSGPKRRTITGSLLCIKEQLIDADNCRLRCGESGFYQEHVEKGGVDSLISSDADAILAADKLIITGSALLIPVPIS